MDVVPLQLNQVKLKYPGTLFLRIINFLLEFVVISKVSFILHFTFPSKKFLVAGQYLRKWELFTELKAGKNFATIVLMLWVCIIKNWVIIYDQRNRSSCLLTRMKQTEVPTRHFQFNSKLYRKEFFVEEGTNFIQFAPPPPLSPETLSK